MNTDCERFYEERDRRTREVVPGWDAHSRPLSVFIGDSASRSAAGQTLLLALANQLARAHRRVSFVLLGEPVKLTVPALVAAPDLQTTVMAVVRAVDPCGVFSIGASRVAADIAIGIGEAPDGLDWYLGANRLVGVLSDRPQQITDAPSTKWGAGVAACLGASAAFRSVSGIPVAPARLSGWSWAEGADAELGREEIPLLDVGAVLQVGAGAVGSSLDYWAIAMGHAGSWQIIDGDVVQLHNTNRSMLFLPLHAGWPGGVPMNKARAVESIFPSSVAFPGWWAEWTETTQASMPYDLVLPLANGEGVRESVAQLQAPVLLHATTSSNWSAQLHRHIAGVDDCITCRMAGTPDLLFTCATGSIGSEADPAGRSPDAALPFLSALAGLMLASALARLQSGDLASTTENWWSVDLRSANRLVSVGRHRCHTGCETVLPAARRARFPGGRWSNVDPARR
jgi:hypothetical protein